MEYGSVTPIGLPSEWLILIDKCIANLPCIIVGAGMIQAKLSMPGKILAELPGANIIEGLSIAID